jgi:hypothetical protein
MIQTFLRIKLPASWHLNRFTFEPNFAQQVPMQWQRLPALAAAPSLAFPNPWLLIPPIKHYPKPQTKKKQNALTLFARGPGTTQIFIYIYTQNSQRLRCLVFGQKMPTESDMSPCFTSSPLPLWQMRLRKCLKRQPCRLKASTLLIIKGCSVLVDL